MKSSESFAQSPGSQHENLFAGLQRDFACPLKSIHIIPRFAKPSRKYLTHADYDFSAQTALPEVSGWLEKHILPSDVSTWRLVNSLNRMALDFAAEFRADKIRLRLAEIGHDQCRLFHFDFLKARALCTLWGAGTEYLEESEVNREGLGKGSNDLIVKNWKKVRKVKAGDIIVMRGESWGPGSGLIHRSPPIAEKGLRRMYFACDV